jgi:hypothetical protein
MLTALAMRRMRAERETEMKSDELLLVGESSLADVPFTTNLAAPPRKKDVFKGSVGLRSIEEGWEKPPPPDADA